MTPSTPSTMTRTITTHAICTSEHGSALVVVFHVSLMMCHTTLDQVVHVSVTPSACHPWCAFLSDLFDLPFYFDLSFPVFFHSSVLMHPDLHTDIDNLDSVENNLRHSAKGSLDAYDVTFSLTPDGRIDFARCRLRPNSGDPTAACRAERTGGRTRCRARSRSDRGKLPAARSGPRSSPPAFSTARKCGDGERQQGPCPVASQRSASENAPRDGGSHGGRGRLVAHETRCSPRGRGASHLRLGGGHVGRSRRGASIARPLCWRKRKRDDAARVGVAAITAAASVL